MSAPIIFTEPGIFASSAATRAITCLHYDSHENLFVQLNGRKRVNMVHVDDIVKASRACLVQPQPGKRINVAGHHFFLSELIQHCKHPPVPDAPDNDLSSKCVESNVLEELMGDGFDFLQPLTRNGARAS